MGLINARPRCRLDLVQVGLAGDIVAALTQLDGALRGRWMVASHLHLDEFLSRNTYELPDGTPIVRLDRTGGDLYFARLAGGPFWDHNLPAGYVRPRHGPQRRHTNEPWSAMSGWSLAPDVYAALAPAVGVVLEYLVDRRPHAGR